MLCWFPCSTVPVPVPVPYSTVGRRTVLLYSIPLLRSPVVVEERSLSWLSVPVFSPLYLRKYVQYSTVLYRYLTFARMGTCLGAGCTCIQDVPYRTVHRRVSPQGSREQHHLLFVPVPYGSTSRRRHQTQAPTNHSRFRGLP